LVQLTKNIMKILLKGYLIGSLLIINNNIKIKHIKIKEIYNGKY